jgi:hypothetical protein
MHVFVPAPVLAQAALVSHPPLVVAQALIGVHTVPVPEYPVLQAHVLVPGPVDVQLAVAAHPPLLVAHDATPVQVVPSPV